MSGHSLLVHIGHYGSGKTELSLNEALRLAAAGKRVALADLDIVNPFFRSGERADLLREAGVHVIMPLFVNTTVDIPALPAEVQSVFTGAYDVSLLDVGGDPAGATALGRYHRELDAADKWVRCVVNTCRPLTATADEIVEIARDMQERGRVRIDALINNANLAWETTPEIVAAGYRVALEAAEQLGIPLEFTMAQRGIAEEVRRLISADVLPIDPYIRPDWL